jgi:stage II sporulation protein M
MPFYKIPFFYNIAPLLDSETQLLVFVATNQVGFPVLIAAYDHFQQCEKAKEGSAMTNLTRRDLKRSTWLEKKQWANEGLSEARHFIYLASGIFFAGIVIGAARPEPFGPVYEAVGEALLYRFEGKGTLPTVFLLFIQNATVAFASILLGFLLGLVPILSAAANGVVVGVLFSLAASSSQLYELWKLLPHGVFELPAIFTAWGLGIWHGTWIFRKDKEETLGNRRRKAFLILILYILPLLIVAAVIEGLLAKL